MTESEVIVIGAGVVGAAVTYRLAQGGARVTLVDAGEPGRGTSASSFAWLNSHNKEPRHYHDLNVAGIAEHLALAGEFADAPWLHLDGGLTWATTTESDDALRIHAADLRAWDYPIESVPTERAMRELEPGLRLDPRVVPEVWRTSGEGWADVPLLIHHLLDKARERGVTVRPHAAVTAIEHQRGQVLGVRLADGARLAADAVVNCAGPRADDVAALAGVALPLTREPGLLAVSRAVTPPLRHVCRTATITFRPDPSGGLVLAHADDLDRTIDAGTPTDPLPPACAELLDRAARFYPDLTRAGLATARIGVRPIPIDGVTIAGQLPGFTNFYVAVTHSGVTLGALLGRLIAEEIRTGEPPAQLAPFRPERFAEGARG